MSTAQINATQLLCRLLEQSRPEVNGAALLGDNLGPGGTGLIRERLLVIGAPLTYVTCPECGIETARVVRDVGRDQILLYCDECGDVEAGRELQQTYRVSLSTVVRYLMIGLGVLPSGVKKIQPEISWRLGLHEPKRGKPVIWYFARNLKNHAVAKRVADQIRQDKASLSAKILTSSELPLAEGSPLAGYDLVNLWSAGRLSQNRFLFFDERATQAAAVPSDEVLPTTSLLFVREKGWAFIDGVKFVLEGMQQKILLCLIDAHAHRLEGNEIGARCESASFPFKPVKYFGRNKEVYSAFIKWDAGDKVYELVIPPEDSDWL